MNYLYESSDILSAPYEAFIYDASKESFPVKSHWHYFVEIIYMIEGTAFVESNQQEYYISEGDLVLFHAGDVHAIYAASHMPPKYLVLKFDSNRLSINSNYTPKLSAILQYARKSERADILLSAQVLLGLPIRERFETCIREINQKEYGYDVRIHGEISSLLIEIIRIWQNNGFQIRELFPIYSETESSIHNITEYIDKHSHETMKGEELLFFTDSSLSEISQETGFSDCSHFIKTFRKWKKITPGQYRSQHRQ